MAVDFVQGGTGRQRRRFPVEAFPAPTVMASGIGGGNNVTQYWLEGADRAEAEAAPAPGKPPYRVPPMAEIAAVPPNGLVVASSFSGCGGSCLGYRMAGFEVRWANEFVEAARDSYRPNHPGTVLDPRDIRDVQPGEVLDALGMAPGELDLFDGSPPCQSFSTAGKRSAGWGKVASHGDGSNQRSDDLFFEYARLVEGIQPRAFVAENVSGLVKGVAKGYFKEIHARLAACGYLVEARLLDAQWLGVPQARTRIIFQGVRADLAAAGLTPSWPAPLPYRYSIRDALPWLGAVSGRVDSQFRRVDVDVDGPAPAITASGEAQTRFEVQDDPECPGNEWSRHAAVVAPDDVCPTILTKNSGQSQIIIEVPIEVDPETGYRLTLEGTAIASEYDRLAEGETSDRYYDLARAHRERPSPTVTASGGSRGTAGVAHPVERRKFTLLELRRICGFPDDFELSGTYQERWARLGNSVPPPMMRAVAEAVRDGVLLPARPAR